MSDFNNDHASDTEIFLNEIALRNARVPEKRLRITGYCYNCDDPVKDQPFCDADCRDDYEARVAL